MYARSWKAVSLLVAFLLLSSAFLKGHHLATRPTSPSDWLETRFLQMFAIQAELLLGLALLCRLSPKFVRRLTITLFCLFASVSAYRLASGAEACDCFGRVKVHPAIALTIDVFVVSALLLTKPKSSARSQLRPLAIVVGAYLLLGLPLALLIARYEPRTLSVDGVVSTGDGFVLLEPQMWDAKSIPLFGYIDGSEPLRNGEWRVMFYHHECSKCQQLLPSYLSSVERVAIIEVPPYGPSLVAQHNSCLSLHLTDVQDWFLGTPVQMTLNDGTVSDVKQQ